MAMGVLVNSVSSKKKEGLPVWKQKESRKSQ